MSNQSVESARIAAAGAGARRRSAFIFTLLAAEFLDELAYGTREAAWPLIRRDLDLSYTEIGLLLSVPALFGNLLELPLGVLGDVLDRRALVLWGGACFAAGLLCVAGGYGFAPLLLAFMLMSPASGAFVGLSQAALMDAAPARREQNMARWAFTGSLGQVAGSLALGLSAALGLGWRAPFALLALVAAAVTLLARRHFPKEPAAAAPPASNDDEAHESDDDQSRDDNASGSDKTSRDDDTSGNDESRDGGAGDRTAGDGESGGGAGDKTTSDAPNGGGGAARGGLVEGLAGAWRALRRREVVRWLALLELADLMLDGLHGFIALYFVDVVGVEAGRAALAVAVWTGVGLAGDFLVIPLLERVRGLSYLRASACATLVLFPAFLVAPGAPAKLVLLALLGVANAGWYSILKAQLYAALPRRSGTVLTLHSAAGFFNALLPVALGLFAARFGLGAMMWLLIAAPVSLLALIPRAGKKRGDVLG